jgi:hypothetical protein
VREPQKLVHAFEWWIADVCRSALQLPILIARSPLPDPHSAMSAEVVGIQGDRSTVPRMSNIAILEVETRVDFERTGCYG